MVIKNNFCCYRTSAFLFANLFPIVLYVFWGSSKYASIMLTIYSLFYIGFHYSTYFLKKISSYKLYTIPYGVIAVIFSNSFKYCICSNIYNIIIVSIVISLVPVFFSKTDKTIFNVIFTTLCAFSIIIGQFLYLNQSLDESKPQIVETTILEKYANSNWFDDYSFAYFDVYCDELGILSIYVSKDEYIKSETGDKINLLFKEGAFGISYCQSANTGDGTVCSG